MNQMTSVQDLLKRVTEKLDLPIDDYFLYCHSASGEGFVPDRRDVLDNLVTLTNPDRPTDCIALLSDIHVRGDTPQDDVSDRSERPISSLWTGIEPAQSDGTCRAKRPPRK